MPTPVVLRVPGQVVAVALRETFVLPVRTGHVDPRDWRRPVPALIITGYVVYALLVLSILTSAVLVDPNTPLNQFGIARTADLPVTIGYWFAMVLIFLAATDLRWGWRLFSWAMLISPLALVWASALISNPVGSGLLPILTVGCSAVISSALLLVAAALGTGRELRWSVVVLAALGFGVGLFVPSTLAADAAAVSTSLSAIAVLLAAVSLPLAVAAGTAFAQVAVNLSTFTLAVVRDRVDARLWPVLTCLLLTWVIIIGLLRAPALGVAAVVITVCHTVITLLFCRLALWRTGGGAQPLDISNSLADRALLFGALLGSWGLLNLIGEFAQIPLLQNWAGPIADLALFLGCVIIGIRRCTGVTTPLRCWPRRWH